MLTQLNPLFTLYYGCLQQEVANSLIMKESEVPEDDFWNLSSVQLYNDILFPMYAVITVYNFMKTNVNYFIFHIAGTQQTYNDDVLTSNSLKEVEELYPAHMHNFKRTGSTHFDLIGM